MLVLKAFSIALAAAPFVVACEMSPLGPSPIESTSRGERGEPVISGVQIVGPHEVPPGETVQFNLIATLSDRTTRDVTNEANWIMGDDQVASMAGPGRVTGRERGAVRIESVFGGQRARWEVFVLPAGTYRLYGRLNELRYRDIPLAGARVEVTTGAGLGLSATTDREGIFYLYGVAGDTTLRVAKDGYSTATKTFTVADHQSITVELAYLGKYLDLSGTYTLMIAAASHCGVSLGDGNVPEEARVRTYTATVQQDGPSLGVLLNGPGFSPEFPFYFAGRLDSGGAAAFILENRDDGLPLGERLPSSRRLSIDGKAVALLSATGLAGTLSGAFQVFERFGPPVANCSSEAHQFVLAR